MIVFFAIKERLKLDAFSFWYGEIIALLVIDVFVSWLFITVMGIQLFVDNITSIIISFLPALLISIVALWYFGRKQRQIQSFPTG